MTAHPTDIAGQVRSLLIEHLGLETYRERIGQGYPPDDAQIIDDLGADSLDCIEIMMAVEAEFEMEVSDDQMDEIVTVWDIIELVTAEMAVRV